MVADGWNAPATAVMDTARAAIEEGNPATLATVVAVEGNAYRQADAKTVVPADTAPVGSITAGCLADEVTTIAAEVRETGHVASRRSTSGATTTSGDSVSAVTASLRSSSSDWTGRIALQSRCSRAGHRWRCSRSFAARRPNSPSATARTGTTDRGMDSSGRRPAATPTPVSAAWRLLRTCARQPGGRRTPEVPPPSMSTATPAPSRCSSRACRRRRNWSCSAPATTCHRSSTSAGRPGSGRRSSAFAAGRPRPRGSRRPTTSSRPRRPTCATAFDDSTYAVVMTHNYVDDQVLLAELLETPVPYIGVMGPGERTERLIADVEDAGTTVGAADRDRLYALVGLGLGGGTPYQIAQSIVAETLVVRNGWTPQHLSEKDGAIHDPDPV